ncbi:MAG: NADH-quinone oxidoreductase subunit B family protein [Planctomycetota bacterium]|jgi:coenzyme F420-reducing hydrogenase gamma subunit
MSRLKVAFFDFACCEGCQLQIYNMEEEILELLTLVEPVEWREAMSDQSDDYDVAIVEGSITRAEDEERLKAIRKNASVLIALGSCATTGGVNNLKNNFEMEDVRKCVYGKDAGMPHLDTYPTKGVGEVVKVDYIIPGCPTNVKEFAYVVRSLALGKKPVIPSYPVCVECKMKENVCRFEYNEICLGPITRAGCDAKCPSSGMWCFGCRGPVDNPNIDAAKDVMDEYGKTIDDLQGKIKLFQSKQEN